MRDGIRKEKKEDKRMNWKEKGFLLLIGGIAGLCLAGAVFDDDDDSDSRLDDDGFDADDSELAEE